MLTASAAKSSAILNGQMSALDRIRMQQQQAQQPVTPTPAPAQIASTPIVTCSFEPAVAAPIETRIGYPVASPERSSDFLASSRVPIGFTPFNSEWERVSGARLSSRHARTLLRQSDASGGELLGRVNSWVNRSIAHTEDRQLYGMGDYWASAAETLSQGRGDCEDFAILKYQMLAAMGVDRDDMYLTLATDLVRGADHAVLIVRMGDTFYMLDNATDAVLPADQTYDYRPMFSYSGENSWLHGYTRETTTRSLAYLSTPIVQ